MGKKTEVIVLKNNIPAIKAAVSKDNLLNIAEAGGRVIEAYAKINIESKFSNYATQNMANSVIVETNKSTKNFAEVKVGPTVIYGRIQELGGVIKPLKAKMLSWIDRATGVRIFAKKVTIPARPYLRPAVDENMGEIEKAIGNEIEKLINEVAK